MNLGRTCVFWAAFIAVLFPACGRIAAGTATGPRDPVPSGILVASGTFSALVADKAVAGGVSVYDTNGQGTFVVRLESYSGPSESVQLKPVTASATLAPTLLRANRGTMNYIYQAEPLTKFSQVFIYSPANAMDYAKADLR